MQTPQGHGPDTPPAPNVDAPPADAPPAADPAVAALTAQVADLTGKLGKVKDEAAARRISEREAVASATEAARVAGETDGVIKGLTQQLADMKTDLEGNAHLIDMGRAYTLEAEATVAAASKTLPTDAVAALDAAPDITAKLAMLKGFAAMTPASPAAPLAAPVTPIPALAPGGAPGVAPAAKPAVDLMVEMNAGRMSVDQAEAYDPTQFATIMASLGRQNRPPSPTLGLLGIKPLG